MAWTAVSADFLGARTGVEQTIVYSQHFDYVDSIFLVALILPIYATITCAVLKQASRWLTEWMPRQDIDSQRPGGHHDGALGALAGLTAVRALKKQLGQARRTLATLSLCEEEVSRFPATSSRGSRSISARIGSDDVASMCGVGLDPGRMPEARCDDIESFVELHIEQGPILEHAGLPAAAVDAITGIRHYLVELTGTQNHAGTFPMDLRHDPMQGFAEMCSGVVNTAHRMGLPSATTRAFPS